MAEVRISVRAAAAAARFRALSGERLRRALRSGLAGALDLAAGELQTAMSAAGIEQRSGRLSQSIRGAVNRGDALSGLVGVPEDSPARVYAGLLTAGGIRPTTKRALTIPAGENLTGAGRARYPNVAALVAEFGARVKRIKNVIGVIGSERAKRMFRLYFVLVGAVRGRDVIEPTLRRVIPGMTAVLQTSVDKATQ